MKFQLIIYFSLFLFSFKENFAQLQPVDARDNAMGNATVACKTELAIPKNIAFIPGNSNTIISGTVSNKYFIKDLSPVYLTFIKTFNDNFSISSAAGRVGNNSFTEQFIEAGIAKKINPKFSVGLKFQFYKQSFNDINYEDNFFILPTVGLFTNPLKDLCIGVTIRNPVRSRVNAIEQNQLPATINPGISYKVSKILLLAFSVLQETDKPLSCHAGGEYNFHKNLAIRFGWQTVPVSESFGFMLKLARFNMDVSFQTHPVLGNSSSITLNFPL